MRCGPRPPGGENPDLRARLVIVGLHQRLGNVGGTSLDRNVWIPLRAFERTFGATQTLQVLARAPQATDPADRSIQQAEDRARASMRDRRQLGPGADDNFDVLTPDAARGFVLRLSERVGLAAGPISIMALRAAIVVVTNTILVSVTQRTREIGVHRALGASAGQVQREVLVESALIAVFGGGIGVTAVGLIIGAVGQATGFELSLGTTAADSGYAGVDGKSVQIHQEGEEALLKLGGTVAAFDLLTADASGQGVAITASTALQYVGAVALQDGSSGQFIRVRVKTFEAVTA